jgi:iron complex outermembrane recepter protein
MLPANWKLNCAMRRIVLCLLLAGSALSTPVLAQEVDDSYHSEDDRDIVVTGALRVSRQDALSGVAVITSDELASAMRPSLGETLTDTPGVSATSFGPNASRPVLRGLQGERVRVLSNGIGSIDASNTSADHAPAINPLLAKRIEVLRGPQALQYGSAAIGGVVNVIDRRIPSDVPDEPVHFAAMGSYGSAAQERSFTASADVALGGGWVAHVDGAWLKTSDLRIGGFAMTPALRAEAIASSLLPPDPDADPEIDFAANAAVRNRLPNSAARTWSLAGGAAYIGEGGNLGVAYSRLDNRYGIPIRFATSPGDGQEGPSIQIKQDRIDARAEVMLGEGLLEKLAFRYAFADYRHSEIEEDGTIATTFFNQGMEGRLELAQVDRGGWTGASGVQFVLRDFDVVGEEAYLPRNESNQLGLFTVQQLQSGPWRFEAGLRYERTRLKALPAADQPQFFAGARSFNSVSASLGAAYDIAPGWKVGINLSEANRAPAAEELFANGPHVGTETFELGDPFLRKERARSIEAIVRGSGDGYDIEVSAYYSWFGNFIYEAATGNIADGLPEFQITQDDARLYGFEVQAEVVLARPGPWTIAVEGLADYVRTTIEGSGPAPRIPPLRVKGGLNAKSPHFDLGIEVEHATKQDRVAAFETATSGFTLVNAEAIWRPWGSEKMVSLVLSANNLFDVVARRHASFLKDYAPLPGSDIRVSVRAEF